MLRRWTLYVAVVFAAASCTPVPGVTAFVDQVSMTTRSVCRFVPVPDTVDKLVALKDSDLATAAQIASAICEALAESSEGMAEPGPATIRGVEIEGSYV